MDYPQMKKEDKEERGIIIIIEYTKLKTEHFLRKGAEKRNISHFLDDF